MRGKFSISEGIRLRKTVKLVGDSGIAETDKKLMQNVTFRFSGLRKPFKLVTSNPTLRENKLLVLNHLLNLDAALEELVKIIQVSLNSSQLNPHQKKIISSVESKIQKELEFVEEDETSENFSKKSEFSSQETLILSNSIRFIISGQIISSSDEDTKLSNLKNLDKNTIIIITLNFRSGFDFLNSKEQENSSNERREEEEKFEVPEEKENPEYQKKNNNLKVANISTYSTDWMENVIKNLSKLNRNGMSLTCVIKKDIRQSEAKQFIQSQDWSDIDTIFCWGNISSDYTWFGDFLLQQLKNGKGIVLCYNAR